MENPFLTDLNSFTGINFFSELKKYLPEETFTKMIKRLEMDEEIISNLRCPLCPTQALQAFNRKLTELLFYSKPEFWPQYREEIYRVIRKKRKRIKKTKKDPEYFQMLKRRLKNIEDEWENVESCSITELDEIEYKIGHPFYGLTDDEINQKIQTKEFFENINL